MYIYQYLKQDSEEMPQWLKDYKEGTILKVDEVLNSRTLFYPGARDESTPIRIFNQGHAVHVYIYSDFCYEKNEIDNKMSKNEAFLGYHLIGTQEFSEKELVPNGYKYHVDKEDIEAAMNTYENTSFVKREGYCLLKIYERNKEYDDNHGAERFALMYIGGDSFATYDALFGNGYYKAPFCLEVSNYMGAQFDNTGLFKKILERTNSYPKYLLKSIHMEAFTGYKRVENVEASAGGTHPFRELWIRQ